jgi:threonine aldolase
MGGGAIWPLPLLQEVCAAAKRLNLALHLDGSRLLNASVASGIPAHIICAPFDSVALCFSKGLGAPVGSCLAGDKAFIDEARRYKQLFGGAMRQAGIIAAGALFALRHNIDRLADDHANARRLAAGFAKIPGIRINLDHVETNIVFFDVVDPRYTALQVSECLAAEGVYIEPADGANRMRAVTHSDINTDDIDQAIAAANKLFS